MRIFLTPVILGFVVLTTSYSGNLFSFLTIPSTVEPINTIEGPNQYYLDSHTNIHIKKIPFRSQKSPR